MKPVLTFLCVVAGLTPAWAAPPSPALLGNEGPALQEGRIEIRGPGGVVLDRPIHAFTLEEGVYPFAAGVPGTGMGGHDLVIRGTATAGATPDQEWSLRGTCAENWVEERSRSIAWTRRQQNWDTFMALGNAVERWWTGKDPDARSRQASFSGTFISGQLSIPTCPGVLLRVVLPAER